MLCCLWRTCEGLPLEAQCLLLHMVTHMSAHVTVSWSHVSCPLSHVWVWICLLRWLDFQLIIHFTYDCCVNVCGYHVSVHATAHTWRSNIPQHTCGGPTCNSTHVEVQEQLYGMRSLLPLLNGFQELKSGHQADTVSDLTSSAILLAWLFFYLLLILWKHKHTQLIHTSWSVWDWGDLIYFTNWQK